MNGVHLGSRSVCPASKPPHLWLALWEAWSRGQAEAPDWVCPLPTSFRELVLFSVQHSTSLD